MNQMEYFHIRFSGFCFHPWNTPYIIYSVNNNSNAARHRYRFENLELMLRYAQSRDRRVPRISGTHRVLFALCCLTDFWSSQHNADRPWTIRKTIDIMTSNNRIKNGWIWPPTEKPDLQKPEASIQKPETRNQKPEPSMLPPDEWHQGTSIIRWHIEAETLNPMMRDWEKRQEMLTQTKNQIVANLWLVSINTYITSTCLRLCRRSPES